MKTAVMYGGGKIGRGFIGQKMHDGGYDVCFLDAVPALVDEINRAGGYNVYLVSNAGERCERVEGVHACMGDSSEGIQAMEDCDVMATAVGARNLEGAAENIARALERRAETDRPLNIILAENQMDVDKLMRSYLYARLSEKAKAWADANLGLVAASIQRMVPQTDAAHLAQDSLAVMAEPFSELPVDADAVKGQAPDLPGLICCTPFSYHEKRKLYMHNMAHALCAYLAYARGYTYIWQAVEDPDIRGKAKAALDVVGQALSAEYGVAASELQDYAEELLNRFANRALGDTVARVGADPIRKLRCDDRLVGAALYVQQLGLDPQPIVEGIVCALRFDPQDDTSAAQLQRDLQEKGLEYVLNAYMHLAEGTDLAGTVEEHFFQSEVKEK